MNNKLSDLNFETVAYKSFTDPEIRSVIKLGFNNPFYGYEEKDNVSEVTALSYVADCGEGSVTTITMERPDADSPVIFEYKQDDLESVLTDGFKAYYGSDAIDVKVDYVRPDIGLYVLKLRIV